MVELVDGASRVEDVRVLIKEYTDRLGFDLGFQNLDAELEDPVAKYGPPRGGMILAVEDGRTLGMVAFHPFSETRCEMKRLYVRPEARGRGIGRMLAEEALSRAKSLGYEEMLLDSVEPLRRALGMYERMGFVYCGPYYHNPRPDAVYMSKRLRAFDECARHLSSSIFRDARNSPPNR